MERKSLPEAVSSPLHPVQSHCSKGKFTLLKKPHKVLGSGCCAGWTHWDGLVVVLCVLPALPWEQLGPRGQVVTLPGRDSRGCRELCTEQGLACLLAIKWSDGRGGGGGRCWCSSTGCDCLYRSSAHGCLCKQGRELAQSCAGLVAPGTEDLQVDPDPGASGEQESPASCAGALCSPSTGMPRGEGSSWM